MESSKGNFIELRIILLGDSKVGKKSIARRCKILKSTETKEISLDEFVSKKLNKDSRIKEILESEATTEEEKKEKKLEEKRINLMRFKKIFKLESNIIHIKFYPLPNPEELDYDYGYNQRDDDDNDYEFEKKYKMSIRNIIRDIKEIIMGSSDDPRAEIEFLFLLCFDLSDFSTFENLVKIFSHINKKFDLTRHEFKFVLVGNKLDCKKSMSNEERENLINFQNQLGIFYYEISSLMFFNFENFFEKLILDNYSHTFSFLKSEIYKNIFHNTLHTVSDFPKKKRLNYEKFNGVPGANKYNNNVYEYPKSKRELLKIFSRKDIFNKKIFINKQGILFPPIQDIKDHLNSEEFDYKSNKKLKGEYSAVNWDSIRNEKIQSEIELNSNKPGCTIASNSYRSLGLKKERDNLRELKDREIIDQIDGNIISGKQILTIKKYQSSLSQKQYFNKCEKNRNEQRKKELEERKEMSDILKERHNEVQIKNSILLNQKIFRIKEKHSKYDTINLKKNLERERHTKKARRLNTIKTEYKSPFKFYEPKGKFYSPIPSISTNKGFTFGLKLESKPKERDSPEFPNFLDDFEKLIKKNEKRSEIKSFGERLPVYKTEETGDSSYVMEKQKIFAKKRKKFRHELFSEFFEDRKDKLDTVISNKKEILENQEQKLKEQIQRSYKTNENYLIRDINYSQVEYSYPKYSMKGKPKEALFRQNSDDEDLYDFKRFATISGGEGKVDFKTRLIKPNFRMIFPKYPAFSFGKAKRFNYSEDKNKNNKIDDEKEKLNIRYEENDIFKGYQDTQSFLMAQTFMGTGEKLKMEKNENPGPGMYKIKGFADEVISKANKVNLARIKIKEKEKYNEMDKERREKLRKQWLDDKKSQIKMGIGDYYNNKKNKKEDIEEFF